MDTQKAKRALARAIKQAGGGAALAAHLGLKRQAIYQWEIAPIRRVLEIEALSGVNRSELRPDIYPPA